MSGENKCREEQATKKKKDGEKGESEDVNEAGGEEGGGVIEGEWQF